MSSNKRQVNRDSDEEDEQQKAKRTRILLKKPVRLLDLPLGPLHLIFSKVPLSSQMLLREVSSQMREEHNDYLLHNYKSFTNRIRNSQETNENSIELNIIKVVEEATNFIIGSGYVSSFMNNLPLFFQDKDNIDVNNMQQLLHSSYHELEYSISENPFGALSRLLMHRRRLVYMVTLLNLLRQFRCFRKVSSVVHLMHWKLHVQLKGVHVSATHERNPQIRDSDKLIDFMTLMAELLVYDMSDIDMGFSRYLDIGSSVYNYGIKCTQMRRGPRLDLYFKILGPSTLRTLLEDALDGRVDERTPIECSCLDPISIELDLHNSGVNWVVNRFWEICILPL